MSFSTQAARTMELLKATPGWRRIQSLRGDCDDALVVAILNEAARFAETVLEPLNTPADREGCTVVDGRVRVPTGFADAFRRHAGDGWLAMDVPERFGGQALPLVLQAACAPLFERGCVALMMASGSTRAACHLLAETAEGAVADEWVPRLAAGEWAATICISEPDAGSDLARLRSRAVFREGAWRIEGRKIWISFGDHDMAMRIGHCLLARTGEETGTRGLSLFLVPDEIDGERNGVTVERIEEKMGLHGSPTCALRFDGARGLLLGEEGRGLARLFAMIELMRLQTGCQGLGLASAAIDIAETYAQERQQGGDPAKPAIAIAHHPDIRRQLQEARLRTEKLRAATLELATVMDLARMEPKEELRGDLQALSRWLLPLVKNFGADAGFTVSNQAIQILGGAGYTREWPLEQYLRDARVMTIYEGTTGMQAIDLLTRRLWQEGGKGLDVFLKRARSELADYRSDKTKAAASVLDAFEAESRRMAALENEPETGLWQANNYLNAAWEAFAAWMTVRVESVADAQARRTGEAA
ncbi:acyl-CoA dehydrogenase family protein [Agrobacterium fabrum]|uniref:acyl-CoA dehydrogenase family protein n=2 Tax=Pseudomonadota TaxID=1224 RepID=UPI001FCD37E8|nr:acyl-CoA dehydrogenase family protein [Agrobacterium fabrum]MDH6294898.1 alkylation response protein AidB-like acyl-CoA dehydrogenase [Agrobacterium fabrum]